VYPPGTITAFSAKTGKWRIAVPRVTAGFGIFSAPTLSPLVETQSADAPPPKDATGAPIPQVPEKTLKQQTGTLAFYEKPLYWAIIAGAVVVVGGGSYWLIRWRRAK
jgi:hypothetical protein